MKTEALTLARELKDRVQAADAALTVLRKEYQAELDRLALANAVHKIGDVIPNQWDRCNMRVNRISGMLSKEGFLTIEYHGHILRKDGQINLARRGVSTYEQVPLTNTTEQAVL